MILRAFSLAMSFLLLTALLPLAAASRAASSGSRQGWQDPPPPPPPPPKPAAKPVQDEPQDEQDDAIRLSSRLILVPVSASDAFGNPVKDLRVDDIVIEEEGKPQKVVALGEPGTSPVEIALLFDVSGSTSGQFAFQQRAATQFIKEVFKPGDAVSLFSIGVTPKLVMARTTSSDEAIAGIMRVGSLKEPTAFFDALVEAAQYVDKTAEPGGRRVFIVISDGEDNYSKQHVLGDALREIQKGDCLFYSINPSGGGLRLNQISVKGQGYMEAMAAQTGGRAYNLTRVEELEQVFRQIAAELQAQYLFGYYAADERADGAFRRISVRAPQRKDLRIRARQGYYAPKPSAP